MGNENAIQQINERLREVDAERTELLTALRVLERLTTPEQNLEQVYSGVVINFARADNLYDRLVRMAEAVDGPLDTMEMARCLIQRGVSKASAKNLRGHIINELRDAPDFEKIGTGSYEYRPKLTPSTGI